MKKKVGTTYNRSEVAESRRTLSVETLTAALHKDRVSMRLALDMLAGSGMFSADEVSYAERASAALGNITDQVRALFGPGMTDERVLQLHLRARTLVDEIAVLRESAYWLLKPEGVLALEKIIAAQVRVYGEVRILLRILLAKDVDILPPVDPARLPEIPANPYFVITHPELVA